MSKNYDMRSMPTEREYMARHPDRLNDGSISCGCGAKNLRTISKCGTVVYVCAVCNAMLFVVGNINNASTKGPL